MTYIFWVGSDLDARAAFSVSARQVRGPKGRAAGLGTGLPGDHRTDARQAGPGRVPGPSVSHELRTPLTAIMGYLEVLGGGRRGCLPAVAAAAAGSSSATPRRLRDVALGSPRGRPGGRGRHLVCPPHRGGPRKADARSLSRRRCPMAGKYGVAVDVRAAPRRRHRPWSTRTVSARCWTTSSPTRSSTPSSPAARCTQFLSPRRTTAVVAHSSSDTGIGIAPGRGRTGLRPLLPGRGSGSRATCPGTGLGLNIVHAHRRGPRR